MTEITEENPCSSNFEIKITEKMEIVTCGECEGHGFIDKDILIDYHKRNYATEYHKCKECDGSGLLRIETMTTIKTYKYDPVTTLKTLKQEG